MIIEWTVGVALAGAGAWIIRETLQKRRASGGAAGAPSQPPPTAVNSVPALQIGDVLLWEEEELWLAGELSLVDGEFELRLFRAPGAGGPRWVAWSSLDPEDISVLEPSETIPAGEVPSSLPQAGRDHRLRRRGRGAMRRRGEELPEGFRGAARYALLDSSSRTILILDDDEGGERLALFGCRVPLRRIVSLPGR